MATATPPLTEASASLALATRYRRVRRASLALTEPLTAEDNVVQTIPEVSPTKWHLAHGTWFFERFCLLEHSPGYRPVDERYHYLFNSYYYTVGEMYRRPRRGLLSRPTVAEIHAYRARVDDAMQALIAERGDDKHFAFLVELGLQHEQQHQELMLTDIKHVFFSNPLGPAYASAPMESARAEEPGGPRRFPGDRRAGAGDRGTSARTARQPASFTHRSGGVFEIGATGSGFCFDNETPRHQVLVRDHALGHRLVTNGEFRDFIDQGGYDDPALWLSDGWALLREEGWRRPLYWSEDLEQEFTLAGWQPIDPAAPVCHVSYYEADAFARWAGARLPTEAEWELTAAAQPLVGNFLDSKRFHPAPPEAQNAAASADGAALSEASLRDRAPHVAAAQQHDAAAADSVARTHGAASSDSAAPPHSAAQRRGAAPPQGTSEPPAPDAALLQLYGDVWEWTSSPYAAYPGFKPLAGSLGEYNGKFMCNQMVVRGGSCVTWAEHTRATYRSFFYPRDRWQFLGFRLAKDM